MKNQFTLDEQTVIDFLNFRRRSTATEIATFIGSKNRGVVARLLKDLAVKGVLGHTEDAIDRYNRIRMRT